MHPALRWVAIPVLLAGAAVGVAVTPAPALACVADPTTHQCVPPPSFPGNVTWSRYVTAPDMYPMGCNQGRSSDSLGQPRQMVILSFGDPGWVTYGTWGAWTRALGGFVSNAAMRTTSSGTCAGSGTVRSPAATRTCW